MKQKLTAKQKAFCREYVINHNATQSATKAEYSKKTAYSQGQRLLKKDEIKNEIERLEKKNIEKVTVTAQEILTELKRIAFDLQDEKITYKDKLRALELLGKHLGMFIEKQEVSLKAEVDQRILKIEMEAEELARRYAPKE